MTQNKEAVIRETASNRSFFERPTATNRGPSCFGGLRAKGGLGEPGSILATMRRKDGPPKKFGQKVMVKSSVVVVPEAGMAIEA
jgi:hypothetical protein